MQSVFFLPQGTAQRQRAQQCTWQSSVSCGFITQSGEGGWLLVGIVSPALTRISSLSTRIPGLEGITAISAWDTAGTILHQLPYPVKFSLRKNVSSLEAWSLGFSLTVERLNL